MSDTVSVNPQRGKAFWLNHVNRWQESGLSKAAYCKQYNLSAGNFYHWSRPAMMQSLSQPDQLARSKRPDPTPKPIAFLPLNLKPSVHDAGFACVKRGGTDVSLPTDLDPAQLQVWLAAIHQLYV